MIYFTYGKKSFTKFLGYFGEKTECPQCGKSYCRSLVRHNTWAHFDEIPLFPIRCQYIIMCPICANSKVAEKAEAKKIVSEQLHMNEDLTVYGKDIIAKHQKGIFTADTSKELWVRDNKTGEEILVAEGISSMHIKKQKKYRGLKEIKVTKE